MVRLIEFGHITYKIIYPILLSLVSVALSLLSTVSNKLNKKENPYGNHQFVYTWIMFLAEALAIICYIIKQISFPTKIISKILPKKKPNKITFILCHITFYLLLSLLDLGNCILITMSENFECKLLNNSLLIVRFLFFMLFGYLLLHYKYYRHHFLGASIFIFGMLLNCIISNQTKFDIPIYEVIIFAVVGHFIESFQNYLEKYLMVSKFYDPFMLIAGEGISGLIIMSIILPIVNTIKCKNNKYNLCNQEGKPIDDFIEAMTYLFTHKEEGLTYLGFFITLFFYNNLRILTTEHFTPLHRNIAKDLRGFILFFIKFIPYFGHASVGAAIGETGTYIVMFIGDLIFLEIIILDFCGFNNNTKEEVIKRENEDYSVKRFLDRESSHSERSEVTEY